jgi:hypothetical protein
VLHGAVSDNEQSYELFKERASRCASLPSIDGINFTVTLANPSIKITLLIEALQALIVYCRSEMKRNLSARLEGSSLTSPK